jgi:membrane protease YdiL (CAAX protease family)
VTDDRFARELRGFGWIGILAIVAVLSGNLLFAPLSAILVLVWAWISHTPWRDLGFVRPAHWVRDALVGIVIGGALKIGMKTLVLPLLTDDPINHRYHFLVGNTAALPGMLAGIFVIAAVGEETFFRGYMFERLRRVFGSGRGATALIVTLTSALFGLAHWFDQGLAAVYQAAIVGAVYALIYVRTGSLWMSMWTHAAFDVVAVAIIYRDLEARVAHLVFH